MKEIAKGDSSRLFGTPLPSVPKADDAAFHPGDWRAHLHIVGDIIYKATKCLGNFPL